MSQHIEIDKFCTIPYLGGMFILQLFDWYSASISVILICILEVVMVAWIYGVDNFLNDIYFMIGKYPSNIWKYCWKYITPIILVSIFFTSIIFNRNLTYNGIVYPTWAIAIGWLSCSVSIACIPLYMLYVILGKKESMRENLRKYLKAADWTPAKLEDKLAYEEFLRSKKVAEEIFNLKLQKVETVKT